MVRDWRIELVKIYPDLFHPVGDPPVAQGFPDVRDGWCDLLERACARIQAVVQTSGGSFNFRQIKQKWGCAQLYWEGSLSPEADACVQEAVALAVARSACTCEICGEPGRLYSDRAHRPPTATRCTQHADGRSLTVVRPGFENIHIKSWPASDGCMNRYHRYERETDCFVDVDPNSLGIDEE
jgi:hypothetical protein